MLPKNFLDYLKRLKYDGMIPREEKVRKSDFCQFVDKINSVIAKRSKLLASAVWQWDVHDLPNGLYGRPFCTIGDDKGFFMFAPSVGACDEFCKPKLR